MRNVERSARIGLAWFVLGLAAWSALAALAVSMYVGSRPPSAGIDLELLLHAGRRVAAGLTPYDVGLVSGGVVEIQSLFFSYPPLVAQATSLLTGVPSQVVMIASSVGSALAMVAVGRAIARRLASREIARRITLVLAAVAPLWFPYALALLFGNIDAWFPAIFGLLLLPVLPPSNTGRAKDPSRVEADAPEAPGLHARAPGRRDVPLAGLALAVAAATKLHPASVGLWFLVRGLRDWRGGSRWPRAWAVLASAAALVLAIVAASLLLGGTGPWLDYVAVLRAGTNADLLDGRNLGPAVQVALTVGGDLALLRAVQAAVLAASLVATVVAAWSVRDPVESLAWATVASFVVLPVTWYHYPAALMPFAVAAVARAETTGGPARRRTRQLGVITILLGIIGVGLPVMWLAVLGVLLMVRTSAGRRPHGTMVPASARTESKGWRRDGATGR
jgi:hypothetical protein